MKTYKRINDTAIEIDGEEYTEKVKTRPCIGENAFILKSDGIVYIEEWSNKKKENIEWDCGNGFFSQKEVYRENKKRKAIQRVKDYIIENFGVFEPDWKDKKIYKFNLYFNFDSDDFVIEESALCKSYSPYGYLRSEEQAKQLRRDCKDDLLLIHR